MGMLENMAGMLRRMKELNGKSIEEWSEELGIASSTLQDYLKGSGNPTVKMVDHLARKLDIDPLALMSGKMEPEQYQIVVLMLDTIKAVAALPHPKRVRFANLFLELTQLWEGNVE
jgi:transcriptional regulator with XRE-family HTH domain